MSRIIKITETTNTGLPNSYGYARKCLRVVECEPQQNGWKSERGVKVLWESDHYNAFSQGPKSLYRKYLATAKGIAVEAQARLDRETAVKCVDLLGV